MKTPTNRIALFIVFALIFSGCTKDKPRINKVPVVEAGPTITVSLSSKINTIKTAGSATDADGQVVSYLWSQISGPNTALIEDAGSAITSISGIVEGAYKFQLMAVDNDGATGVDTFSLLVDLPSIDSLSFAADVNNGYRDFSFSGNGAGLDYSDATSPEIDAAFWSYNGGNFVIRGGLFFDLGKLPSNITIVSAKLDLYSNPKPLNGNLVDANYGANNAIFIERITSNWSMSSGWNTQPTTSTDNHILIPHTSQPRLDLIGVDVTNLVKDMLANTNYGFEIRLQNEVQLTSRLFCGVRYSDVTKHPKLQVVYQRN